MWFEMCNRNRAFVFEKVLIGVTLCLGILGFTLNDIRSSFSIDIPGTVYGFACMILAMLQLFFCLYRITPVTEPDYAPIEMDHTTQYCCGECGCRICYCNAVWMSIGPFVSSFICLVGGGFAFSNS